MQPPRAVVPLAGTLIALSLVGCTTPASHPKTKGDSAEDTGTNVPAPCASGDWGEITLTADTLHVNDDAAEGGDGSGDAPFRTIAEALALTRVEGAARNIALWPGSYAESLALAADVAGLSDNGLTMQGCGSTEVTLAPPDKDDPGIKISEAADVTIAGMTIDGGKRGFWVWQGATVAVADMAVIGSSRAGVVIDGSDSIVTLDRVAVSDPQADTDGFGGYGFAFQRATVTMTNATVDGATTAGILVDGSEAVVTMSDVTVNDTASAGSLYGRGIQMQGQSTMSVTRGTFTKNHDAGIFALQPGLLTLDDVGVNDTLSASIVDSDEDAGDGIVVTHGSATDNWEEPYFQASLTTIAINGAARAGVLLSGNGVGESHAGVTIGADYDPGAGLVLKQGGATVTGAAYNLDDDAIILPYSPTTIETDPLEP